MQRWAARGQPELRRASTLRVGADRGDFASRTVHEPSGAAEFKFRRRTAALRLQHGDAALYDEASSCVRTSVQGERGGAHTARLGTRASLAVCEGWLMRWTARERWTKENAGANKKERALFVAAQV